MRVGVSSWEVPSVDPSELRAWLPRPAAFCKLPEVWMGRGGGGGGCKAAGRLHADTTALIEGSSLNSPCTRACIHMCMQGQQRLWWVPDKNNGLVGGRLWRCPHTFSCMHITDQVQGSSCHGHACCCRKLHKVSKRSPNVHRNRAAFVGWGRSFMRDRLQLVWVCWSTNVFAGSAMYR